METETKLTELPVNYCVWRLAYHKTNIKTYTKEKAKKRCLLLLPIQLQEVPAVFYVSQTLDL